MIDIEISVIASGSNGNCCLVEDKKTAVLIDAGKSGKETDARMNRLGKSMENVDAIVLTHSHRDHCASAGILSRRYRIPVYMQEQVHDECQFITGDLKAKYFSGPFKIGSMKIEPVETSHDVVSCGFKIKDFGIFTDTGKVTQEMIDAFKKLRGAIVESNHDIDMLVKGPYPYYLKQRILSDTGHLSNVHASQFVQENANGMDWVLLGHLSGTNTTPEVTKETYEKIVKKNFDYNVLSRDKESGCWEL